MASPFRMQIVNPRYGKKTSSVSLKHMYIAFDPQPRLQWPSILPDETTRICPMLSYGNSASATARASTALATLSPPNCNRPRTTGSIPSAATNAGDKFSKCSTSLTRQNLGAKKTGGADSKANLCREPCCESSSSGIEICAAFSCKTQLVGSMRYLTGDGLKTPSNPYMTIPEASCGGIASIPKGDIAGGGSFGSSLAPSDVVT
mmetsp:Transcript_53016/g.84138  ORF Transcript_53016/g.84138 Transcript_53016/m.84138 type:complete len:204 (+) Transcript_53016:268-879(+)